MIITSVIDSSKADVLVRIEEKGTEVQKTVSLREYQDACIRVLDGEMRVPRVGRLPAGFVDGGVNESICEAIIKVPAGRRLISYFGTEYCIPFPDVVFYFVSLRGKAQQTKVWFADAEGALYHYPFGNVYNDAHICWGGNVLPNVECMKDFEKFISLFFSAPTNNDLYSGVKTVVDGKEVRLPQRDLIEMVSKMDAFPMELLNPFGLSIEKL